ncbi:hypothetical protein PCK2_001042, partial [Pneumocystis canis]
NLVVSFLSHKKSVWSAQELARVRVLKKFRKTLDPKHFLQLSALLLRHRDASEVNFLLNNDQIEKSPKKSLSALQSLIEYEKMLDLQDAKQKKDNVDKALQLMNYSCVENKLKTYQMDLILGLVKETTETKKDVMDRVLGLNQGLDIQKFSKIYFNHDYALNILNRFNKLSLWILLSVPFIFCIFLI